MDPIACGGGGLILGMAEPEREKATSRHTQTSSNQLTGQANSVSVPLTEVFKSKYFRWFLENDLNTMGIMKNVTFLNGQIYKLIIF